MNRNYVNRRQTAGHIFPTKLAQAVASALLFASGSPALFAMPTGGQVSAGQAQIGAPVNGTLTIEQTSSRAAINWQSFGIAPSEAVRFNQPSSSSIVLNRVLGVDPSNIYGSLSANGQVFLLNPNGVLFAPGAQVNVGGIVASTLQLADTDFMAGRYTFSKGTTAGSVINQGTITAANGGYVALLGPQVKNEGVISAALGTVALAAGNQITVNLNGNSLVSLTVDQGAVDALVQNKQLIKADGGQVIMTAKAADSLIRSVVNNEGIVEGNRIVVEGDRIRLAAGSRLDASADPAGSAPGGAILVGGGYRGQDAAIRNAQEVTVESGATLAADGAGSGSGGTVVVWSDGATRYSGDISARSGSAGGAGGLVEVSGKQALEFRGSVDTAGGTVLLDPTNITVRSTDGDQVNTFGVGQVNALLQGNNVTLDATNNITWNASTTLSYTNTVDRSLTLQAGNNIVFNSGAAITPGTGAAKLSVVLNSDRDTSDAGAIQLTGTTITSNGGAITLGGGANPLTTGAVGTFSSLSTGISLSGSTLDAGAGAISLRGKGLQEPGPGSGIELSSGSVVSTSTGTITLNGTGGPFASPSNDGVRLTGASTVVRSTDGDISITGQGTGSGSGNIGIVFEDGAVVRSTGTGAIVLRGTASSSTTADVKVSGASSTVASGTGDITINANSVDWGAGLLTLQSSGHLLIQPRSTTTTIGIGDGASGTLNLTTAELNGIQNGFASITIGAANGSGAVDVRSYTFKDDLLIRTPAGTGDITLNGALATGSGSQAGSITLQAGRSVVGNTGASVTTQGGDIVLNADRDASGAGNIQLTTTTITSNGGAITLGGGLDPLTSAAIGIGSGSAQQRAGIYVSGSTLDAGAGAISLLGQGVAGTSTAHGIHLLGGSVVGSATSTGAITLNGTGGAGTDFNYGVYLTGSNTAVKSFEGDISITGQGGAGTGISNIGIRLESGALVRSIGTGANAATVTLAGTGGAGTSGNYGVSLNGLSINGSGTTGVTSFDGAISITGTGGAGTSTDNTGIRIESGAVVQSNETGAATVTLAGTGGGGTNLNHGVNLTSNAVVRSADGAISITGTGSGTGSSNIGIRLEGGTVVESTGTDVNAAAVTLIGTGGAGTDTNHGVHLSGSNETVRSAVGAISITGQGRGTGSTNTGISLESGAVVESTGTEANAATVTLQGMGSAGAATNYGVGILSSSAVRSYKGNISITGQAGAGSANSNIGVRIDNGSVQSNGTGTNAATITLDGTGGTGTNFNHGVLVTFSSAAVTSIDGDISMTGRGGGTGSGTDNTGIRIENAALVQSTGTGANAAAVTLTGTGGAGTTKSYGVNITNTSNPANAITVITSKDGDISITGQGGTGGTSNTGIKVEIGAQVQSTGTGPDAAAVTLHGTGGAGTSSHNGVHISGTSADGITHTTVSSAAGDISIIGQGGTGSGTGNTGIQIDTRALVQSTGTDANAATVTLQGTGGAGTGGSNYGVLLAGSNTTVTSAQGDVWIVGAGGSSGSGNAGIFHTSGALVQSTGTGPNAARVTLQGTGGAGTSFNYGVALSGAVTAVKSAEGDISITGQGAGSAFGNVGIIETGALVESTGTGANAAKVTLEGTGGAGTSGSNFGIQLTGNATVKSVDGDISITGRGAGSSTNNFGIQVDSALVQSTGTGANAATVALAGTGGAGTNDNYGVYLTGSNTTVTSAEGAISITGQGAGSGTNNIGIVINPGVLVQSTGTGANAATVTLHGTGGAGTGGADGVQLNGNNTAVKSTDGAISITGQGGAGSGSGNWGIYVTSNAVVESTGTGANAATVTLHGTGGAGTASNYGVSLTSNGAVKSVEGDISITGTGGAGSSSSNIGIRLESGAVVQSTGTGANAATVTLLGTGGTGTTGNYGVYLTGSNTAVMSAEGDISIIGQGTGTNSGSGSTGIRVDSGAIVQSTGTGANAATVMLQGTGGAGTIASYGVHISGTNTAVRSAEGDISISGQGGGTGSSGGNVGIQMDSSALVQSTGTGTSAAAVTLQGIGGAGTSGSNYGINIASASVQSVDGPISITGQGGAGNATNIGIALQVGTVVESTGTSANAATVTLHGTGGAGTSESYGVNFTGSNTAVRSAAGEIVIAATRGGTGALDFVNSTGSGAVASSSGRWLIYTSAPANNTYGGLASGQTALYGRTFAANPPAAITETGNRYLFAAAPGALTVTSSSASKAYGDAHDLSSPVVGTNYALTGFVNAATFGGVWTQDTTANIGFGGAPVLTSAGTAATATVGGYAINLALGTLTNSVGYTMAAGASTGTLTVNRRPVTVTATAGQSKVYGNPDPVSYTFTNTNLGAGVALSGALNRTAGETVVDGPYAISQGTLTNATNPNYTLTYAGDTFAITKRPVTVTTDAGQSKVYGNADPTFTYANSSLGTGVALSGTLNRDAGETVAGGPYAITQGTVTNANNPNYTLSYVGESFAITKRPVTITADAGQSKVYGNADPASYTFTNTSLGTGVALSGALNRTAGEAVVDGPYAITQGTLSNTNNPNYALTYAGDTFAVTKRPVTVTANAGQSKVYGDADPALTFANTSLGTGVALSGSLSRTTGETVAGGPYVIDRGSVTDTNNPNYILSYVPGNFSISPRPVTVTADAGQGKVYGEPDPTLGYTTSNLGNGLTLSGTPSRALGETVAGGPYAIMQGSLGASDSNYTVSFVPSPFTISPRPLTLTANAGQAKVYGNTDPTLAYSITAGNLVGGDALSGAPGRAAGENVGAYAIGLGTLANSNYNLAFVSRDFAINKRPVTVMLGGGQSKMYGEPEPVLAYTHTSLGSGVPLAGALTRSGGESVGTYLMGPGTLTDASNPNYTLSYSGTHFDIMPRPLIVSADSQSRLEGQANPPLTANYSGFAFADGPASLNGALSLATAADQAARAGSYPITPSGQTSPNYAIAYVDGTLSVLFSSLDGAALDAIAAARKVEMLPLSPSGNSQQLVNIVGPGIALPEGVAP